MKFLVVLPAFLAVGFAQYCYNNVVSGCARGIVSVTQLSDKVPVPFVWSYRKVIFNIVAVIFVEL
jgi:hypothetical protein